MWSVFSLKDFHLVFDNLNAPLTFFIRVNRPPTFKVTPFTNFTMLLMTKRRFKQKNIPLLLIKSTFQGFPVYLTLLSTSILAFVVINTSEPIWFQIAQNLEPLNDTLLLFFLRSEPALDVNDVVEFDYCIIVSGYCIIKILIYTVLKWICTIK